MSSQLTNAFKKYTMNGAVDLDTDTVKGMLLTNAFTPNIDTMAFRSDLTNEVVGTGYTAGGVTLASPTVTQDNTDDEGVFDAADISWTTATITARYLALYKSRGGAASADELLGWIDFAADKTSTGGTFLITFNSEGVINLN